MKSKFLIATFIAASLATPVYAQLFTSSSDSQRMGAAKPAPAKQAAAPTKSVTIPKSWEQVPIPKLPAFTPAEPRRVELRNGMVIFLMENHELPLISGSVKVRGGSDSEPASKTGLVDLYGSVWRTGGTEKFTGDQLDDLLEKRAAKVETSSDGASTTLSFNCLKSDFPPVFDVLVDLLEHPAFRADKLELAKHELASSISRRNDETEDIATMQSDILGYGKRSPYARQPEYFTVNNVTRQQLLDWHAQHVAPNNIIVGITGDFDSKEIEARLRRSFDDWAMGQQIATAKAKIDPASPGLYLVDKSDVNQSEIRMISLGIERRNPDYFALQVMNEIFGGGFSSRLFSNLRTKAGLAYSVGGGVGSRWDHAGLTMLEIGTKSESTVEAIQGLYDQLELMKKDAPSDIELKRAKDAILNSFIFNFDTPAKVLRERQTYEFYGYPADFLQQYRSAVEKVTAADVLRVAQKYLHRDQLKVLVVGNASEFRKSLEKLGPIHDVDIAIPGPDVKVEDDPVESSEAAPEARPEPPAPTNPEGIAAVAKLVSALGGQAQIDSLTSLRQSTWTTQEGQKITIEQTTVFPDRQAQRIGINDRSMMHVVTPELGFITFGSDVRQLSDESLAIQKNELRHDLINLLHHAHDKAYFFHASGREKLGDVETTVVKVYADGMPIRWWIADDGKLVQAEFPINGDFGRVMVTTKYSAWQNFGPMHFPTEFNIDAEGKASTKVVMTSLEVNPTIDPALFVKPDPQPQPDDEDDPLMDKQAAPPPQAGAQQ